MSLHSSEQTPMSKKDFLVIEEMANEVLVYNTTNNKLHVLSPVAAEVWKHCDGKTSVREIAKQLVVSTDSGTKEEIVWMALAELEKDGLLKGSINVPQVSMSRRKMMQKTAIAAAIAFPLISTMLAPSAQAQASAPTAGGCANPNPAGNCPPGQQKEKKNK